MENRKFSPLKICHLVLLTLGLATLCYFTCIRLKTGINITDNTFEILLLLTRILAFVFGFIYLILGFKKNAATYYKLFMWCLVISTVFSVCMITRVTEHNNFVLLLLCVRLVLFTVLAVGKDLGKNTTYILIYVLLAISIYAGFDSLQLAKTGSTFGIGASLDNIVQALLVGTAGIMVAEKYIDKASRGAK